MFVVERRDASGAWQEEARFGTQLQAEQAVDEFVSEGHGALSDYRVVQRRNPRGKRRSPKA